MSTFNYYNANDFLELPFKHFQRFINTILRIASSTVMRENCLREGWGKNALMVYFHVHALISETFSNVTNRLHNHYKNEIKKQRTA